MAWQRRKKRLHAAVRDRATGTAAGSAQGMAVQMRVFLAPDHTGTGWGSVPAISRFFRPHLAFFPETGNFLVGYKARQCQACEPPQV